MKLMQIHIFDPVIYPVKLYVVKYPNEEEVNDKFTNHNFTPLNYTTHENTHATTWCSVVRLKETNKFGVLVIIHSNRLTAGYIAHEATHAARVIWDWLTENTTGAEANAYLVGWISDCINQVRTNKFK